MTMLADLFRNFRYAARVLARTPSFTVVAVAVRALGIGATSAIFSLVSAVWLKPLPFADAERIVELPLIGAGSPRRSCRMTTDFGCVAQVAPPRPSAARSR